MQKTIVQLNIQVLRISGMVEVTYLVDGVEVKTSRLQQMIDNGEFVALFAESAKVYNKGNVYEAVMQFRKNLSSFKTNIDKKKASGDYFPDSVACLKFYHIMWDYTTKLANEHAPQDAATVKYGKFQWQVTAADIAKITDCKELQKVINSLNDVCSPGKERPQFAEHFGPDYLVKAKELRTLARDRMKVLVASTKVSPELLTKLQSKGKVTLTAEDLAELQKLLG